MWIDITQNNSQVSGYSLFQNIYRIFEATANLNNSFKFFK